MKKLHNKVIASCVLALISSSPIIASSTTRTLKLPIVTTPGGLKTTNLNTTSTTPASLLLQLRSNSGSGITTVLTGQGGGRPTIVHAGPFLGK